MSDVIYDDVIRVEETKRERVEMTVDIYESADSVKDHDFTTKTNTLQPLQHTGSDSVKIRHYRSAVVCLVLLCVLLLTAVIVMGVRIHTNSTNYTNNTEKTNLLTKIANFTEVKKELSNTLSNVDEWIYYQSSFYYMSKEKKTWTESRQDCLKRRADLIIINNSEEHDFVTKITNKTEFWIGLTDSEVEDTWKWVDGSTLTSRFWATSGDKPEPNGEQEENCAVTYLKKHPQLIGWLDITCANAYQWICEKSILPLVQV